MTVEREMESFSLSSPAFSNNETIPVRYTCDGEDRSPELRWNNTPANTRSLVLIVDDPDAPRGTFTHWVLFDVPHTTQRLVEGETDTGVQGSNDFGRTGYGGPCPPRGHGPHRYFFKLYALDLPSLGLEEGASRSAVEAKMSGHILGEAQLVGHYERR
ncbi:MAG: UPF0098 protein [Herpetosiphonaceae bacterium]|nr:MAG: UPF0098 protein [Herpetosiphonaceae bacterium]